MKPSGIFSRTSITARASEVADSTKKFIAFVGYSGSPSSGLIGNGSIKLQAQSALKRCNVSSENATSSQRDSFGGSQVGAGGMISAEKEGFL